MPTYNPAIVAPLPRWRFGLAALVIAVFALLGLVRALQEPSLGWRFVVEGSEVNALPLDAARPALRNVSALYAQGLQVPVTPMLLTESAGILNEYAEQNRFFAEHALLWEVLGRPVVRIAHADGTTEANPEMRELAELGVRFWFPWGVALLSLSVGLAVWVFRPGDASARWYMLASLGYAFGMLCTAGWGSRLLTQPPWGWQALHVWSHAATFLLTGGLCMVLWAHPNRLGLHTFPWALWGLAALSVLADGMQWLPTIALAFRLPVVLTGVALAWLYVRQWQASQGDPVKRAQLKWLGLLLFAALSVVLVAYAFGATGRVIAWPQNYGLGWIALVFVGLVPLVSRVGLFRLDRWWAIAWLWFLGGLLVVALDLLLLVLLPLSNEAALGLALALGGWAYFPLRQALWARLSRGSLPRTRDVLPDVVALVTAGSSDAGVLNARWAALWDRVFEPQQLQRHEHSGPVTIADQGQVLRIPGQAAVQGLALRLAARGTRLFNTDDQRRAQEIVDLVQHGLAAQAAYQRGAREERQRIASDLHDDLGAKLLTIAQATGQADGLARVSELAREALDDMRLSVRGLTGEASLAADVLADWRAETVGRLTTAGMAAQWQADDPPPGMVLPARLQMQLTRVLREAVSNAIRHSGGRRCSVHIALAANTLSLTVSDDGRGMGPASPRSGGGHGLPNIERRVRKLGGQHIFSTESPQGTRLRVLVPLGPATHDAADTGIR